MEFIHTIFYFIVVIGLLVSIHEFGHFWVARKMGVKVQRFSVGFGKVVCSYQKHADSTEYVLSAIPLGGYVKMVDEREEPVKEEDLPYAFNRQPLYARASIIAAGPIFNLLLAVALLWAVFIIGETGMRPIIGKVEQATLAAQAGFVEGDEILSVNDEKAPTWSEAMNLLFSSAMQGELSILVQVKNSDEIEKQYELKLSEEDIASPEVLYKNLGLKPWSPVLKPIIGKVLDKSPAQTAGLQKGDLIITANGEKINDWMHWVEYVKARPEVAMQLLIDRDGLHMPLNLTPERMGEGEGESFGRIGAGVDVPPELLESLRVTYSLSAGQAFIAAVEKTWFYSTNTLQMITKMLVGKASSDNLSGPISIAQYAGQTAEMGLVPFLKFIAIVSISLGVLNLLPVPVLDGGHLMFLAIEAVKGSPVSDQVQIYFQQIGMLMLMSLMFFAVILDLGRLFQ